MNIKVSDEVKDITTKCPSKFYCLEDNDKPMCDESRYMCKADRIIQGNGLFIEPISINGCPYRMSFGYGFICHCPTRHEIYYKYNI